MSSTGGWNRSTANQPTVKKGGARALSVWKGIAAGAATVVVVGGGIAWYCCSRNTVSRTSGDAQKSNYIPEVTPTVSTNAAPAKPVDPREDYDHEKLYRDERGILRFKDGNCRAPDPTRPRLKTSRPMSTASRRLFESRSERAIAALVMGAGGGAIIEPDYSDPSFEQDFMNSIMNKIEISDDDTARDRRIKQAVIDAKKEIIERMKKGEKLADILTAAHNELKRLAVYRKDIEKNVRDIVRQGEGTMSEAEVRDYVAAANKMLEANGSNPIAADEFVAWNLRLSTEEGRAREAEREKKRTQRSNSLRRQQQKQQNQQNTSSQSKGK